MKRKKNGPGLANMARDIARFRRGEIDLHGLYALAFARGEVRALRATRLINLPSS